MTKVFMAIYFYKVNIFYGLAGWAIVPAVFPSFRRQANSPTLEGLVVRSFLSEKRKKTYLAHYRERRNRLEEMKL